MMQTKRATDFGLTTTSWNSWDQAMDAIVDIVTIQDLDHRILQANGKVFSSSNLPPNAIYGRSCHQIFHGSDQPCEGCPAREVIEEPARIKEGRRGKHRAEIFYPKLNKTLEVSASPLYDRQTGKVSSLCIIAHDITSRRAMERQLRQARKLEAIGTLAGGIAHDFNNILTPIIGYSELICHKLPPEDSNGEMARQIYTAGMRARDLVRQILSFSRQGDQERKPIDIRPVLKETLKLLRSSLPTTIEIRIDIDQECGMVEADPTSIQQVVMNLCTNAHYAMQKHGGILAVVLQKLKKEVICFHPELKIPPGSYLRLTVSDTGYGIEPRLMERIFDPYFTTKPTGEGTGLGLSVAHGIINDLGGQIRVYSEIGHGTTFHIYLPEFKGSTQSTNLETKAEPTPPTGNERLLVVDDEAIIASLIDQTLSELGYKVTACTDPRQALEWIETTPGSFDLVLSDFTMPHLNGAELARMILDRRPDIPIILTTGFSGIFKEKEATTMGIRRLLQKPITRNDLAEAVREELDRKSTSTSE